MITLPLLVDKKDPILHKPAAECSATLFGPQLEFLCHQMLERMVELNGLGLAANQVGLDMRLFVMNVDGETPICAVNPRLVDTCDYYQVSYEGCLNYKNIVLPIQRATQVVLEYYTPTGELKCESFKGIAAHCVQHEMDHLNGITILDKALEQLCT